VLLRSPLRRTEGLARSLRVGRLTSYWCGISSTYESRAVSNAEWGCRGKGECCTPRPCTFALAHASSPDDRVPSRKQRPAWFRR
jgi:hypothetical protein